MKSKLRARVRRRNPNDAIPPLLALMERPRPRWVDTPRAARWVARRCGIASPSAARLLAELAGLGDERC